MRPSRVWLLAGVVLAGVLSGAAPGQAQYTWRAIDLHPSGAVRSEAHGVSRVGVSGTVEFQGQVQKSGATIWGLPEGAALQLLLRPPDSAGISKVNGADEHIQCGYDEAERLYWRASLWFGRADSLVDLHPEWPGVSTEAKDVRGNMTVGVAYSANWNHALVWLAPHPALAIDLHPPGASNSSAYATDGERQGGSAYMLDFGSAQAVVWDGSPQSMVVMHPPGYGASEIYAMAPGAQAGLAYIRISDGRVKQHAILWHDAPESWIDMHPSFHFGANSYIWGTTGQMHVGYSKSHAGMWFGDDPDSFLDLHQVLPGDPSASSAEDIDVYDDIVYVAGYAVYEYREHAIIWIGTPRDGASVRTQPVAKPAPRTGQGQPTRHP